MDTIWKYNLQKTYNQQLETPKGALFLNVALQNDKPVVWFRVNSNEKKTEILHFLLVPTGQEINQPDAQYLQTLLFNNGNIRHLFKTKQAPNLLFSSPTPEQNKQTKLSAEELTDRIKGCIYGHAIGDAIGLSTEFLTRSMVKDFYPNGVINYSNFIHDKHRSRWKPGEWTDDTDQMLCILNSILEQKSVNEYDVARKIHEWAFRGGRGIGSTVYQVITDAEFLFDPHKIAKNVWIKSERKNAANGAIMRTSILGVWDFLDLEKVDRQTEAVARITHYDPRSVGSSVMLTNAIALLLQGYEGNMIDKLMDKAKKYHSEVAAFLLLSNEPKIEIFELDEPKSIGYTLKAMGAAFWALRQDDFQSAILEIVHQGGDADTNAAVAGALLGTKLGYRKLPTAWIDGLENKYKLNARINRLIKLMKRSPEMWADNTSQNL